MISAASRPDRLPWDLSPETLAPFGPDADFDPDRDVGWELYFLPNDFSQAKDIAAKHPEIAAYAFARLRVQGCAIKPGAHLVDRHTDGAYAVLQFSADCGAALMARDAAASS